MYALDVQVSPPNSGFVSLQPAGGIYPPGTDVTLTAAAHAGYEFVQYSGDVSSANLTTVVTMDADKSALAEFSWRPATGNPRNLLVTGFLGANVREFDRFEGTDLGQFVATGAGGISFAGGIDVGSGGDLFVVDIGVLSDTRLLRFDGQTGESLGEFVAGPGGAGFVAVRFGPNGNLFIPNTLDNSIGEYSGDNGAMIRTFVTPGSGGLDNPLGLTFSPGGNLFVVSKDNDRILEFDGQSGSHVRTVVELSDFGLSIPVDLVFGPEGALYVTISSDESVAKVDVDAGTASAFIESRAGGLDAPGGILFHPDTGHLLVVSQGTNQVLEYDGATGEFLSVFAAGADGDSLFFMAKRLD
jgi:DNA-binding beta-propeller fold protein YncE